MTQLPILWQRLVTEGATCPRCDGTQGQLMRAVASLRSALAPLGIEPVVIVKELDAATFRAAPDESNRIWIGGKPLEEWLGAQSGSSQCCSVCGDAECRTTELGGAVYEEVPERLIVHRIAPVSPRPSAFRRRAADRRRTAPLRGRRSDDRAGLRAALARCLLA